MEFLGNLVQKQKQDKVLSGNSLSDAVQNIGKGCDDRAPAKSRPRRRS